MVGRYCGQTIRDGNFGQYRIAIVAADDGRAYTISGTKIIQLMDVAAVGLGDVVRVVFNGVTQIDDDRSMKDFDLYIAEEVRQ